MLSKHEKLELAKVYNKKFASSSSIFVLDYKGLSVKEMQKLRKSIKKVEAELSVVKNNVLKYGASGTDVEKIVNMFIGPTAIALCDGDPVSVAKVFVESAKEFQQIKIKGGIVDGSVLDENEITNLSKLPSREVMYAQIMGLVNSPLINLLNVIKNMQCKVVYAISAVKNLKQSE
jgi:large subunit ribosomal protein L10